MVLRSILLVAPVLLAVAPGPGTPPPRWGHTTHELICELAWLRLEPATKNFIRDIGWGEDRQFSDSCDWADRVRRTTHRNTRTYHYVNIPPSADGYRFERDCDDRRRCVTWAIQHYAMVVQDASGEQQERSEALRFLAHFVGDVHQPLHAIGGDDRGGNDFDVTFDGASTSLHAAWDGSFVRRAGWSKRSAPQWHRETDAQDVRRWTNTDVVAWTNESFGLANEVVYPMAEDGELDSANIILGSAIIRERLQQAGVRLAHLLNCAANGKLRFSVPPA